VYEMRITIGKNKALAEEQIFGIHIIISKRRSINFTINGPITISEFIRRIKKRK